MEVYGEKIISSLYPINESLGAVILNIKLDIWFL